MNSIVKKVVVFSLIGVMQVGIGMSITEASSRHNDKHHSKHNGKHHEQRYDRHRDHDHDREYRIKIERERHEREMRRHDHESDWQYNERMEREKEHHEEVMRTLGALAILAVVLDNN